MNSRDSLLRKARKQNNEEIWKAYKTQRNKCTNLIKKAKATYHKDSLNENRFSPRKLWNAIKSIYPIKSKSQNKSSSKRANEFGK